MTFRFDNTDGFAAWELAAMNAALAVAMQRCELDEKTASDLVHNASVGAVYPGASAEGRPAPAEDLENAAQVMDCITREALHDILAPCEPRQFGLAYVLAHEAIFGERFKW
jgi:hypothetical protein